MSAGTSARVMTASAANVPSGSRTSPTACPNRPRRRTNRKNHLNLPVRASIRAARSLFVRSARCFDNVSVRSARCCCRRALLPLFAGSQGLIQRGALLLLVFLTGCVSLEKSYPDRRYFALELVRGKSPNSTGDRILSVASLRIATTITSAVITRVTLT